MKGKNVPMINHNLDGLLLTTLLDAMPDAVLISDTTGTILRANTAVGALFGYAPEALTGNSINMLMPQALAERHDGIMQSYMDTGKARIIGRGRAVEGLRHNGATFPLHLSIGRAEQAGATQFVAILHDLSHRIAAQDALGRSARMDAVGQMTAGISHDFNNILTVLMGNLELLHDRLQHTENRAILTEAFEAAELGADLTAGLSAFGRQSSAHYEPVDVNVACQAAIALIRRTFDPKHALFVDLGDLLPTVLADSTQLQSALINVALNSRDAMPDGGKLVIRSEMVNIDDDYIAQELNVAKGVYVRISVTDTGHGMGPDTQQRVFEPFFTTKPLGHGTGLGLATVYGFVRQCGGHATVYSEIGIGTSIALYFPVIDGSPSEIHATQMQMARRAASRRTVLVVEDNPQLRRLTSARLRELGYSVRDAANGDIAATILKNAPDIDAVFTDIVMPGELDGLALARLVQTTYPEIRVMLTSGCAEDILSGQSTPHNRELLRKPYRQSELSEALARLFSTGSPLRSCTSQVNE